MNWANQEHNREKTERKKQSAQEEEKEIEQKI